MTADRGAEGRETTERSSDDAEPPDSVARATTPVGQTERSDDPERSPSPARRVGPWSRDGGVRARAWTAAFVRRKLSRLAIFFFEFRIWALALAVGVAAGSVAVGFMHGLDALHTLLFGAPDSALAAAAREMPPLLLIAIPTIGGLIMGLVFLRSKAMGPAPYGVADVIEAHALRHAKIDPKRGALSTLAALTTLGFGGSAGREGPVVVAGATISSLVSSWLKLSSAEARVLLGCAVAAAVSASFNAPIAGALFALEVVLGHYAVRTFAPVTIASVAGAVLSRVFIGDEPAFQVPVEDFGSYAQFPAFFLLGLLSAAVAVAMMSSIFFARDVMDRLRTRAGLPMWLQPAAAGLALGVLAVWFPNVLAVGYYTTSLALAGGLTFETAVILAVAKGLAVALTLGGRFAGGVFSPALMLGALTGAAFGSIAHGLQPDASGGVALYALAGMGAVAGAVLGAPVSTTLIVFELTGDYAIAIAVMVSTSVATVATQQTLQKSFFHWQLMKKNIDLCRGPQTFLLNNVNVGHLMRARGAEDGVSDTAAWALVEQGVWTTRDECVSQTLPRFRNGALPWVPVVAARTEGSGRTVIGAVFYVDALKAYNRVLREAHEEEHS